MDIDQSLTLTPPGWLPSSGALLNGGQLENVNIDMRRRYNWLDGIAIAKKLDEMDAAGKGDALARDYKNLENDINKTKDLLSAADVQVKVGSDAKDILSALKNIEGRLAVIESKQDNQGCACTIS